MNKFTPQEKLALFAPIGVFFTGVVLLLTGAFMKVESLSRVGETLALGGGIASGGSVSVRKQEDRDGDGIPDSNTVALGDNSTAFVVSSTEQTNDNF